MTYLLPTPRVPGGAFTNKVPPPDLLDSLVPGAGAGVARALAARQETLDLISDLEACRPGGLKWRDAMSADAQAFASGSWPKKSNVETLLGGSDLHRWAKASAAARTLIARRDAALAESRSTPGLVAAARKRETAARTALEVDAQSAWMKASTGRTEDRPAAWKSFAAARESVQEIASMCAIVTWAESRDGSYDPAGVGAVVSPEVLGYLLACEDTLENKKRLALVKGAKYPSGFNAAASMVGAATSTGVLTQGYAEVPEPGGV